MAAQGHDARFVPQAASSGHGGRREDCGVLPSENDYDGPSVFDDYGADRAPVEPGHYVDPYVSYPRPAPRADDAAQLAEAWYDDTPLDDVHQRELLAEPAAAFDPVDDGPGYGSPIYDSVVAEMARGHDARDTYDDSTSFDDYDVDPLFDAGYAPGRGDDPVLEEFTDAQLTPAAQESVPPATRVGEEDGQSAVAAVSGRLPSRKGKRRVKRAPLGKRLMRLWPLALALLVATAVGLVAMSAYEYYSLTHPAGVSTKLKISGDTDSVPVVSLEAPLPLTFAKTTVVTKGKGAALTDGAPVLLRLTVFDGTTGELLSSGEAPHYLAGRVDAETLTPDLKAAVLNQTVGSRLALRRPVARGGDQAMEIDVIDVLPTSPTGSPTKPDEGAPVQISEADENPDITHLAEEPPASAYLKVQRAGEGAQVGAGASVIANFKVWRWHDKHVTSNTWEGKGPQVIDLAGAMTGLREQLSDQRVGSRVIVVLPPEQAKGDDTLIVVADILAIIDSTN